MAKPIHNNQRASILDNLENKAAIFAMGGMSIGNVIVLLDDSKATKTIVTPIREAGGNEKKFYVHSIQHSFEMIFVAIILVMISPLLIIVSIKVCTTFIASLLFGEGQPGIRGCRFFRFGFRGMGQTSKGIKFNSLNPNESNEPAPKIINDHDISESERILLGISIKKEQTECWQPATSLTKTLQKGAWKILPDGNEVNIKNWTRMEIQYVDNGSLNRDTADFFKTFRTVLLTKGY